MVEDSYSSVGFKDIVSLARGLEAEQKLQEAKDAFDAALRNDPSSQPALEGRARVAIKLREDGAADHCARALAFHDHDPELQMQMIATAAVELGTDVIPLIESYLAKHPGDVKALELLAELRAQEGAGDDFFDGYTAALDKNPTDKRLLMSFWSMLSRSGRHLQAIESMDAHRTLFEADRDFKMLEIAIAGHAGQFDRAGKLLETLDFRPDAQLARGMHRLQSGDPAEAAKLLSTVIASQPDNLEAWALLELAWRISGDPRHEWLIGQPGLFDTCQLELGDADIEQIGAALRSLHRAKAHPLGQSLRGGTQTAGQLFLRSEPEIVLLIEALATAIRQFIAKLPPADPIHPLLKYRDSAMAFGPSWSVRFTETGHHAAHFHPGGILSSACYIAVPETIADEVERPGWLEIGRPPPELGLDLSPIATFEPKPGRLVLFPSFLFHGTRMFSGGERLTVAFDLVPVDNS